MLSDAYRQRKRHTFYDSGGIGPSPQSKRKRIAPEAPRPPLSTPRSPDRSQAALTSAIKYQLPPSRNGSRRSSRVSLPLPGQRSVPEAFEASSPSRSRGGLSPEPPHARDRTNDPVKHILLNAARISSGRLDSETEVAGGIGCGRDYFSARGGRTASCAAAAVVEDVDGSNGRMPSASLSARKVSDLPVVEEKEMREAMEKLVPKHSKERAELMQSYAPGYGRWRTRLRCGFSLLFYGFGSKKALLESFAASVLTDGSAIVVNGYLPSVNIKHVLTTVAETLFEQMYGGDDYSRGATKAKLSAITQSTDSILTFIELAGISGHHFVYLILHNIDGPAMRSADVQEALSQVAACKAVHVVASVDHIHAPLLWDRQMSSGRFNWWWQHTPTYAPYTLETAYIPPLLAARGAEQTARSAIVVLQSLTPNARSVFNVLANQQLSQPDEAGLPMSRLYTLCREQFLVSSEMTLRTHLTEFRDHELVRTRRGCDGQDCLYIPLPADAIRRLLSDMDCK
ncbi:hypothetical protein CBR_g6665 [Chara braunii]|uniref:Origin recognition complex subunit 2 n=1 Tax=Chara braunii TaxID=69332 RepID=A0A388KKH9_CHABU|nr:hypothetical protein CBR_g6665 [Chara braunii]|eukprot:GBG70537.1 hypothetical protein CBR_g6665 [Chara braunii]